MRLLVCDWDYFFPTVDPPDDEWGFYDWSHSEQKAPLFQELLWHHRAFDFLMHDKPLPQTSGADVTFWDRFHFSKKARCYVSNSNLHSMHYRVRRGVSEVHLFDAHHDAGYKPKLGTHWTCENWGIFYLSGGVPVTVNYPSWRTRVFEIEAYCMAETASFWAPITRRFDPGTTPYQYQQFDKVHICRSDAWTPPWIDAAFHRFVAACPLPKFDLEPLTDRAIDLPQIQQEVQIFRESQVFLEHYRSHA